MTRKILPNPCPTVYFPPINTYPLSSTLNSPGDPLPHLLPKSSQDNQNHLQATPSTLLASHLSSWLLVGPIPWTFPSVLKSVAILEVFQHQLRSSHKPRSLSSAEIPLLETKFGALQDVEQLLERKAQLWMDLPTSTGFNQNIPIITEETPHFPPTAHLNLAQSHPLPLP